MACPMLRYIERDRRSPHRGRPGRGAVGHTERSSRRLGHRQVDADGGRTSRAADDAPRDPASTGAASAGRCASPRPRGPGRGGDAAHPPRRAGRCAGRTTVVTPGMRRWVDHAPSGGLDPDVVGCRGAPSRAPDQPRCPGCRASPRARACASRDGRVRRPPGVPGPGTQRARPPASLSWLRCAGSGCRVEERERRLVSSLPLVDRARGPERSTWNGPVQPRTRVERVRSGRRPRVGTRCARRVPDAPPLGVSPPGQRRPCPIEGAARVVPRAR
jgi:hypothetical protein